MVANVLLNQSWVRDGGRDGWVWTELIVWSRFSDEFDESVAIRRLESQFRQQSPTRPTGGGEPISRIRPDKRASSAPADWGRGELW